MKDSKFFKIIFYTFLLVIAIAFGLMVYLVYSIDKVYFDNQKECEQLCQQRDMEYYQYATVCECLNREGDIKYYNLEQGGI